MQSDQLHVPATHLISFRMASGQAQNRKTDNLECCAVVAIGSGIFSCWKPHWDGDGGFVILCQVPSLTHSCQV